jgi:regulator of nucleoside diphosphate kinase
MPTQTQNCLLSTKDHTILEVMLERCLGRDDPMRAILEEKLAHAVVMFRDDLPPTIVTLNSRVRYRVNDQPAETRIVSNDEMRGLVGSVLSITNPRGLALLGLAEGQTFRINGNDSEEMTVLEVSYQPEAAAREAKLTKNAPPRGPFLRVVHRCDDLPEPERPARTTWSAAPEFDDPGPSAA